MSRARPLPLPPSGISVWRPLASPEGGLVAIVGSGPSEGEHTRAEDVQCVWCGLRSHPAAACDVCGSPLYESISIWQPDPTVERMAPHPEPAPAPTEDQAPAPAEEPAPAPPDATFRPFRRFAGLEINWIRLPD